MLTGTQQTPWLLAPWPLQHSGCDSECEKTPKLSDYKFKLTPWVACRSLGMLTWSRQTPWPVSSWQLQHSSCNTTCVEHSQLFDDNFRLGLHADVEVCDMVTTDILAALIMAAATQQCHHRAVVTPPFKLPGGCCKLTLWVVCSSLGMWTW